MRCVIQRAGKGGNACPSTDEVARKTRPVGEDLFLGKEKKKSKRAKRSPPKEGKGPKWYFRYPGKKGEKACFLVVHQEKKMPISWTCRKKRGGKKGGRKKNQKTNQENPR